MPDKIDKPPKRLNVRLDAETHRALRLKAAAEDKSIQDLVEDWLRQYLSLPPRPPDEGAKGGVCFAG